LLETLERDCGGPASAFFGGIGAQMEKTGHSFWECAQPCLKGLAALGLSEADVRALTAALHALGRYDSAAQAEAIDRAVHTLNRAREEAEGELNQKGRVYRAMGVTVGIMLALIAV